MTWKDFIEPFRKSGIFSDAAYKILLELFKQAGSIKGDEIAESTVKSWLNGTRNCKVSAYFLAGSVDTKNLFRYFRNRPDSKLKQLQQIFQIRENIDFDSPIDVKTNNMDIFCWSLVNQFLDLLDFQRVDIPDHPTLGDESVKVKPCEKCCLYCIHWQGDKSTVGPYRMPTLGTCLTHPRENMYHMQNRLSSSAICENYQADQNLLSNMKRVGYDVESLI